MTTATPRTLDHLLEEILDNQDWAITPRDARDGWATAIDRHVVRPQQFAAAGEDIADGETDAAPAIQAAIEYVEALGGGTVYLPVGEYLIESSLTVLGEHITIEGAGPGATRIVAGLGIAGTMFAHNMLNVRASNFLARGIWWIADPTGNQNRSGRCINFRPVDSALEWLTVENCRVDQASAAGIRTEGLSFNCTQVRIVNCTSHGCAVPFAFDYRVEEGLIANNIAKSAGGYGISLDRLTTSGSRQIVVANNIIEMASHGVRGISILGAQNVVVEGNIINSLGSGPAEGIRTASLVSGAIIGNRFLGAFTTALHVIGTQRSVFTGNIISGQTNGLNTDSNTINCLVQGNHFFGVTNPITGTLAASNRVRNNFGLTTEAKGTATIGASATSVTFNHGLSVTPSIQDIHLSWATDPLPIIAGMPWVSAITATQITVSVPTQPGGDGWTFGWQVQVL